MNLQKQYKEETGESPTDLISGFRAFTDCYVKWLEDKVNS